VCVCYLVSCLPASATKKYSLQPILLFANTNVSTTKMCLGTFRLVKCNMDLREYKKDLRHPAVRPDLLIHAHGAGEITDSRRRKRDHGIGLFPRFRSPPTLRVSISPPVPLSPSSGGLADRSDWDWRHAV
jgi:hypothetical protein